MKVLSKNKERNDVWKMKVWCTGKGNAEQNAKRRKVPCGAILEIEAKDIYITEVYGFGNSYADTEVIDYCYTIKCPCCGAETDISKSKLPKFVKEQAEYNEKPKTSKNEIQLEK